jgi:hypothetical protein
VRVHTRAGGGDLEVTLSEASIVRIVAGDHVVVPRVARPAGRDVFRWRQPGARRVRIRIDAWDLAGNRAPSLRIRLRRYAL